MAAARSADLSEFEQLGRKEPELCKVARLKQQLSDHDRVNVDAALAADHIAATTIVRWFRARNMVVGDKAVKQHRVNECCCER